MTLNTNVKLAERLAEILLWLHSGKALCAEDIAAHFGVDLRTAYRDLNRIGSVLDEDDQGKKVLACQYRGKLTPADLRQFATLAGIEGLFPSMDQRFLTALLDTWIGGSYLVKGPHYEHCESYRELMQRLEPAIQHHRLCQFDYAGKQRQVEPYRLINSKGIWYLAAVEAERLKAFHLGRIKTLIVLEQAFQARSEIRHQIEAEDGIWFSSEKTEVLLHVAPEVASYFTRRTLLPHQEISKKLEDGSLIVATRVAEHRQILPLVFYWLPHVRVISPDSLKQQVLSTLNEYLNPTC